MPHVYDTIKKNIQRKDIGQIISSNDFSCSYSQIKEKVNRFTNYLISIGVTKGDVVVIYMSRSCDCLIVILSVMAVGGIYAPIDIDLDKKEIINICNNLKEKCIVCDPQMVTRIPKEKRNKIITLHDDINITEKELKRTKNIFMTINDPVYIMHTSGSTGKSKGVVVSSKNIINHIKWLVKKIDLSEKDIFNLNSSIAFDFSVACTLIPFFLGSGLYISNENETKNISKYINSIKKNRVTILKWTPSYFKIVLEYVEIERIKLPDIRWIILGGEELASVYLKRWNNIYPTHLFLNEYGPTETTVAVCGHVVDNRELERLDISVPIGAPEDKTRFYLVDNEDNLIKGSGKGELFIGGDCVTLGYFRDTKLSKEKFVVNKFDSYPKKLYRTGDIVTRNKYGVYTFDSRMDSQVKISGYRVYLKEIEQILEKNENVHQAIVMTERNEKGLLFAVAYVKTCISEEEIIKFCVNNMKSYMVPKKIYLVTHIPLTNNNKIDIKRIKRYYVNKKEEKYKIAHNFISIKNEIMDLFIHYSGVKKFDMYTNFSQQGLSSLDLASIFSYVKSKYPEQNISQLMMCSNLEEVYQIIDNVNGSKKLNTNRDKNTKNTKIAIIAMECITPGARNCDDLWDICSNGKKPVFKTSSNENNNEVFCRGKIEGIELFDSSFFGVSDSEADMMDPQHRLILEASWTVMEKAGYAPKSNKEKVSVFISSNDSTYLLNHYVEYMKSGQFKDNFSIQRLTSPGFISTKVAYHLNCTGAAISQQTACSSSLVSIVLACQEISLGNCDLAIAGGVSITTPQDKPYIYQKGNIFSPDGNCNPFSDDANGTLFSNGLGVVVLKKYTEAIKDNDNIISVIAGYSVNNDGASKPFYTTPSVSGQYNCIIKAIENSGINPDNIRYIEAHGTGTQMGDPIEIQALVNAFRQYTDKTQFCALGSLKANIGHTHVASGVLGVIKASLCINNGVITPQVNINNLNTNVNWTATPFYVNTRRLRWPDRNSPKIAAISSFGIGGTNAHIIIEEPTKLRESSDDEKKTYSFPISAKSEKSVLDYCEKLYNFLLDSKNKHIKLGDIEYTLKLGRESFAYKSLLIASTRDELMCKLKEKKFEYNTINESLEKETIIFIYDKNNMGSECIGNVLKLDLDLKKEIFCVTNHLKKIDGYNNLKFFRYNESNIKNTMIFIFSVVKKIINTGLRVHHVFIDNKLESRVEDGSGNVNIISLLIKIFATHFYPDIKIDVISYEDMKIMFGQQESVVLFFGHQEPSNNVCVNKCEQVIFYDYIKNNSIDFDSLMNKLWYLGSKIDWKKNTDRKKVLLPTYQFNRKHHWFDNVYVKELKNSIYETKEVKLYIPTWKRLFRVRDLITTEKYLEILWIIFDDESSLAKKIYKNLIKMNSAVFLVKKGAGFFLAGNKVIINPEIIEDYVQAFRFFKSKNMKIKIFSFWSGYECDFNEKYKDYDSLFLRLLFLIQAIDLAKINSDCQLVVIASQINLVLGNENINPIKSTICGLIKVSKLEKTRCKSVVVDVESNVLDKYTNFLIQSDFIWENMGYYDNISIRNEFVWVPEYEPIPLTNPGDDGGAFIENGVYLITGGLGAMGLEIANYLSKFKPKVIILISRRKLPDDGCIQSSNDELIFKITAIKNIQKMGIKVELYSADVSCCKKMQEIRKDVLSKYKNINGIFHLAGVPGDGLIMNKSIENIKEVLNPKIDGSIALSKTYNTDSLDFVVFASSLTAIVGGIGQADYCAANIFLDNYALTNPFPRCKKLLVINWNSWEDVGMAASVDKKMPHYNLYQANSIKSNLAVPLIESLIHGQYDQVIVSRFSPDDERERILDHFNKPVRYVNTIDDNDDIINFLMSTWKDILGVTEVELSSDFYSLGGDSILAIELLNRIEKKFKIEIDLTELTKVRTISDFEKLILLKPSINSEIIISLNDNRSDVERYVYFIHPIGGSVICYFPLINKLDCKLSYFALQDPEIMNNRPIFESMDQMVDLYSDHIIRHYDNHVVTLVGYSFGGNLAVEITRKLLASGIRIKEIILLDSWAFQPETDIYSKIGNNIRDNIEKYFGSRSFRYETVKRRSIWLRSFKPNLIPFPITLFKACNGNNHGSDNYSEYNGWDNYCQVTIKNYEIDAEHDNMLKFICVGSILEKLKEIL